ncbi:MAG: hydrogen peroxide-inducible genes activator [Pseudomonadota bacterium]
MIGLTLKHLRYFSALAQHGHFGRAAQACAISQPALSIQIKELEAMLGGPLVERASRQIRLTTLGEDFLSRAREIILQVDELNDLVRSSEAPLVGRLRLGVIPTVAPYLLPAIIQEFSKRFPGLELQPRETITNALIEDMQKSHLDVAIVALPISEPSLQEFALFDEDFVLVRPPQDADKPIPDPQRLKEMRLLLLEEGHCFRDQALSFCQIAATDPRYLMEGSSLSTLVQMVSAGIGLTLIPEMAVPIETRSAHVSIARFTGKPPSRKIGMVWRKSNPLSHKFMEIGAIIRQVSQTQDTRTPAVQGACG